MSLLENLRQFPVFQTVPDEQLQWVIDHGEAVQFTEETLIYKPGDTVDFLFLLLEGRIRIEFGAGGLSDEMIIYDKYAIVGLLPFSRMKTFSNRLVAEKQTHILRLHRDQIRALTQSCYELTAVMVHQMTTRVRDFTKQTQQNEKMASLGRLSAGLAHELNNPVAAVIRAAETLKAHLRTSSDAFKAIMNLKLTDQQIDSVNTMFFGKLDQWLAKSSSKPLTLLQRSSLEDELTDWLDDHGVDDALDMVGPLVEYGFTVADLDWVLDKIGDDNLVSVLNWLVNNLVTEDLVSDISEASKRISTLVGSIKNYTHMDRGVGKEEVQLAEGIQNTLTLLNHKVKNKHITVNLNMPDNLPVVCGWPGELNQVWTNLIDNAIDALPDGGQIDITSQLDHQANGLDFVLTKVIDNGSGIPAEIQDKIFEPFFTTKEIGKGTGLGLDIVQGIVKHHNGAIKVYSVPGRTEFSICLPVQ